MDAKQELYKRYRPQSFKHVIGQDAAIKSLIDMGRRGVIPHCILFTGPSGCGKTTIARILRHKLKCGDIDYQEMNASSKDSRGIGAIAQIQANMMLAPIDGKSRVWMIDEAHQLTGDAQNSLLKTLEDTPSHCYFMLSTTDPQKLKKTIITRSHEVKLKDLSEKDLERLVTDVNDKEGDSLTKNVIEKLVDAADGSARKALVLLHAIIGLKSEQEQLEAISKGAHKQQAIEIARMLLKGASWTSLAKVLKDVDEEPESLRWMILAYCKSVLLGTGGGKKRAAAIIDRFQDAMYESKQAGFVLACWDLIEGVE